MNQLGSNRKWQHIKYFFCLKDKCMHPKIRAVIDRKIRLFKKFRYLSASFKYYVKEFSDC